MNEGKPAKAKWWSRPRPQEASGPSQGATATPDGTEPEGVGERGAAVDTGGDFELARPLESAGADGAGADGADSTSTDGDFELRPASSGLEGAVSGGAVSGGAVSGGAVSADGDFELRPAQSAPAVIEEPADGTASAPADPAADRPRPLHDPDPYSTPPYGEPGPWAPAPPVQHPATTPASGTAVPMPAQATATPAAPAAQAAQSAPSAPPAPVPSATPTPPPTPAMPTTPTIPTQPTPQAPTAHVHPTPDLPGPTEAPPPANPWQNYDPWAQGPALPGAPLQQNGAAVATRQQRRKRARRVLLVGAVLLALVSGGVGGVVGAYLERNGGVGDVELPQAGAEASGRAPDSVAGIAARALPSVVTLHVSGSEEQGTGTGFVLDDRGHILTNNHVVEPAGDDGEISVTFHSGDTAKAEVVGRDGGYDLAVVKVSDVRGLTPLPLGNSDNVQVGDPVVAIGAPFDLEGTVTSGIISAKERPITAGGEGGDGSDVSYVDALQTDAPINPGNSGGPLLDVRGHVVGINSAIRSAGSGSELDGGQSGSIGLGFAIPVNQARRVAEELINTGRATHPVIGVTLDMDYAGDGARVGAKSSDGGPAVTEGGSGDKAGIKPGDVITEVDGQRVHSGEELIVKTRAHRPGDRLELTLERGGKEVTISLTLGSSSGR
ncbi:trypsin-like peptidase domain-containing protein [Streptomyces sp. NPDC093568]|uniref:trypsin-like peptidase domain-containing protein n=1 Tax=Streptomyces sp. NPDC093568 TaxID=3366041 RepID=UPI00380B139A